MYEANPSDRAKEAGLYMQSGNSEIYTDPGKGHYNRLNENEISRKLSELLRRRPKRSAKYGESAEALMQAAKQDQTSGLSPLAAISSGLLSAADSYNESRDEDAANAREEEFRALLDDRNFERDLYRQRETMAHESAESSLERALRSDLTKRGETMELMNNLTGKMDPEDVLPYLDNPAEYKRVLRILGKQKEAAMSV